MVRSPISTHHQNHFPVWLPFFFLPLWAMTSHTPTHPVPSSMEKYKGRLLLPEIFLLFPYEPKITRPRGRKGGEMQPSPTPPPHTHTHDCFPSEFKAASPKRKSIVLLEAQPAAGEGWEIAATTACDAEWARSARAGARGPFPETRATRGPALQQGRQIKGEAWEGRYRTMKGCDLPLAELKGSLQWALGWERLALAKLRLRLPPARWGEMRPAGSPLNCGADAALSGDARFLQVQCAPRPFTLPVRWLVSAACWPQPAGRRGFGWAWAHAAVDAAVWQRWARDLTLCTEAGGRLTAELSCFAPGGKGRRSSTALGEVQSSLGQPMKESSSQREAEPVPATSIHLHAARADPNIWCAWKSSNFQSSID